ncbi:hypothetical protein C0991_003519 [Blastosporella zonata]|nr:hypothetical protein C0991_003519 [Blastosporella zonata]
MQRVEYDADEQVYTFRDQNGKLYKGAPGEDYGLLTPVENIVTGTERVGAFDSESDEPRRLSTHLSSAPSTFYDILPATSITTTKSPVDKHFLTHRSQPSRSREPLAPRARFIDAVRRSALPKMQGVVHDLRRSVTSAHSKGHSDGESERHLLQGSTHLSRSSSFATTRSSAADADTLHRGSSHLNRSDSVATTRSGISVDTPMSVNH